MLGLPYLINYTAYAAVTSIAVIGLYVAYVIPTLLRLRKGEAFERGPVAPGPLVPRRSGWSSVAWVVVITVLFMLPQVSPVTWETFNYAPVAVLVVLGFAATWWLASARHWFLNPDHERTDRPRGGPRATPPNRSIPDTWPASRCLTTRHARVPDTRSESRPRPAMLGEASSPGPLAQLAEQWTFNPLVVGSSPTGPTCRTPVQSSIELGSCPF